jgi:hypothetical protein
VTTPNDKLVEFAVVWLASYKCPTGKVREYNDFECVERDNPLPPDMDKIALAGVDCLADPKSGYISADDETYFGADTLRWEAYERAVDEFEVRIGRLPDNDESDSLYDAVRRELRSRIRDIPSHMFED